MKINFKKILITPGIYNKGGGGVHPPPPPPPVGY